MIDNQDWIESYKELCILINKNIPEIKHIDLYHNQLAYEKEEYPFPESSLFIEFNTTSIDTIGIKAQDMNMQIRFIYAFDTLSDTFNGSDNQEIALSFGSVIRKLHSLLQSKSGNNFSSLNRIALLKEPSPEGVIVYAQTYSCIIRDYSATDETTEVILSELSPPITAAVEQAPPPAEQTPILPYIIPI